jgi:hypothetical protein
VSEVTLREYIERLLREHERAHDLASAGLDARLAQLNELRTEVQTDRALFLTREFYDEQHEALENRVGAIERETARRGELIPQLNRALEDIRELRQTSASTTALANYRRWLGGLTLSVVLAVVGVITAFIVRGH